MNKSEFIAQLAERMAGSKAQAARHLEAVMATMTDIWVKKESLIVPGFATLDVKKRAARSGRNPSTGKAIMNLRASTKLIISVIFFKEF